MDLNRLQTITESFFNRAVIAISYSASARMLDRLTSSAAHGPNIGLVALGLTIICFLLLVDRVRQNACLQTTLSILVSKLVIHLCTPMEPSAHREGWVLPGILAFFLCLYVALCLAVRAVLVLEPLRQQWELIVPFIVVFSTSAILKAIKHNAEMRFLYVAVLCHMLWRSTWTTPDDEIPRQYLAKFVDSIMARGVLLILDDLVFGTSIRPGIGQCLLFSTWLLLLCAYFPPDKRSSQYQLCVGVLTYSLCTRIVQVVRLWCSNQVGITFALVAAVMLLCLHIPPFFFEITPLCANALAILWISVLDGWLFSFYQEWEQLLMYMIIFWGLQGLKDAIVTPVLAKSAQLVLLGMPPETTNKEAMLIASEAEMHTAAAAAADTTAGGAHAPSE
jgi:hypothetical protein